MKILVTGNPNYEGLCQGLSQILTGYDVTFVSRSNGYDLSNVPLITEIARNYNIFINSTNVPNDGQLKLLESIYENCNLEHIINVSTTSVYWTNKKRLDYFESKSRLEQRSKELSSLSIENKNNTRVSCIAFGELNTQSQRDRKDGREKMLLTTAAQYVKLLIDSPPTININYLCVDPRQTKI